VKIKLILLDETTNQRLAVNTFHYALEIDENKLYLVRIDD
jgi:hypothetical protein